MGLYGDHVLPRMHQRRLRDEDERPPCGSGCATGSTGRSSRSASGPGSTCPFYPAAVTRVAAVEPADLGWKLARQAAGGDAASRSSAPDSTGSRCRSPTTASTPRCRPGRCARSPTSAAALAGGAPGPQARRHAALRRARPRPRREGAALAAPPRAGAEAAVRRVPPHPADRRPAHRAPASRSPRSTSSTRTAPRSSSPPTRSASPSRPRGRSSAGARRPPRARSRRPGRRSASRCRAAPGGLDDAGEGVVELASAAGPPPRRRTRPASAGPAPTRSS